MQYATVHTVVRKRRVNSGRSARGRPARRLTGCTIGARSRPVQYRCSACHTAFESAEPPHECPHCHAEAGLEAAHATPLPMKLFGLLLGAVIVTSLLGALYGRFAG